MDEKRNDPEVLLRVEHLCQYFKSKGHVNRAVDMPFALEILAKMLYTEKNLRVIPFLVHAILLPAVVSASAQSDR